MSKKKGKKSSKMPQNLYQKAPERSVYASKDDNSYGSIKTALDTARELAETEKDMTDDWFKEHDINRDAFTKIYDKYNGDIEALAADTSDTPNPFVTAYGVVAGEKTYSVLDQYTPEDMDEEKTDATVLKNAQMEGIIRYAFKNESSYRDTVKQLDDLDKDYHDLIAAQAERYTSEEWDKERAAKADALEEEVNELIKNGGLSSDIKRRQREIRVIRERFSCAYLFDDLDSGKKGCPTRAGITQTFFNNTRSSYVMEKFNAKCTQFGLNPEVLHYVINLEENYLEEKYHVFNNLFLFYVAQYMGHIDREDVREIKQVIQNMVNLVYNKFYSEENKETFLNSMRTFLDGFEPWRDLFNEKNQLHPKHPHRIKRDAEITAIKCSELYQILREEFPSEIETQEQRDAFDAMNIVEFDNAVRELRASRDKFNADNAAAAVTTSTVSETEAVESAEETNAEEVGAKPEVREKETRVLEDSIALTDSVTFTTKDATAFMEKKPDKTDIAEEVPHAEAKETTPVSS